MSAIMSLMTTATSNRPWYRYGFRAPIIGAAFVCVGLVWIGCTAARLSHYRNVVMSIESPGGRLYYEEGFDHSDQRVLRLIGGEDPLAHVESVLLLMPLDRVDAEHAVLSELPNLTSVHVVGPGFTDADLKQLNGLAKLNTLELGGTSISDDGLSCLRDIKGLERIFLQGSQISGVGFRHLSEQRNLSWMDLRDSRFADAGMVHLNKFRTLRLLHLDRTLITDTGLAHLENLTSLRSLRLCGTRVTDDGAAKLRKALPDCDIVR